MQAIHAAVRVASWLKCQPLYTKQQGKVKSIIEWLKDMGAQLAANMVKKPKSKEPEDLKEQGKWLDAPQLMERVEGVRVRALAKVKGMQEGKVSTLEAAGFVHDALFVSMCFGYFPPLRNNSVILTITRPSHSGCIHPDCQHKKRGCLGNRVYKSAATGEGSLTTCSHMPLAYM